MMTNGLVSRLLIFDAGRRSKGQEPGDPEPPESVISYARQWAQLSQGGNLNEENPVVIAIPETSEATAARVSFREQAEAEYEIAERHGDVGAMTVWGRVAENSSKLALLAACSEFPCETRIERRHVQWASRVASHQARKTLWSFASRAVRSEIGETCDKFVNFLRAHGGVAPHTLLMRKVCQDPEKFKRVRESLIDQKLITWTALSTGGRKVNEYRLVGWKA
jgi:hypothetical protein